MRTLYSWLGWHWHEYHLTTERKYGQQVRACRCGNRQRLVWDDVTEFWADI